MAWWDEDAPSDSTDIVWKYYCKRCEEFFYLSPIAPERCPQCFTDSRNILGPIPTRELDLNKVKRRYDRNR